MPLKFSGLQRCRIDGLVLRNGMWKCRQKWRSKRTCNEQPSRNTIIGHRINPPMKPVGLTSNSFPGCFEDLT